MQFASAYTPPLIIGAAATNKVFDSLQNGSKTVQQVKNKTGASERGLRAIMNALVGLELLKKDRQGKYSLTPESENFLVTDKPGSLAGLFAMVKSHHIPDWLHLGEAVKTGAPPVALNLQAHGPQFFSVLVEHIIPTRRCSRARCRRRLWHLGNCARATIASYTRDGAGLAGNDSDYQAHHAEIRRG